MVKINSYFTCVVIVMSAILLNGCAISGSGNPVSTSNTDSNNDIGYIDNKNVTIHYPERGPIQPKERVRRGVYRGKFS